MRVLVVDDDEDMRVAISASLDGDGFAVDAVADLASADEALAVNSYDCVVFDRLFRGADALDYVRDRRATGWLMPVVFVSGLNEMDDLVAGLAYGDYVAKPFAMDELIMRVRAMTRPTPIAVPVKKVCGDIEIDTARRAVRRAGALLTLTRKEFDALDELVTNQGTVVSRKALFERCWPERAYEDANALDKLIANLRKKLHEPQVIDAVRGSGYRIDPV